MKKSILTTAILLFAFSFVAKADEIPAKIKAVEDKIAQGDAVASDAFKKMKIASREQAIERLTMLKKQRMMAEDLDGALVCKNRIDALKAEIEGVKNGVVETAGEVKAIANDAAIPDGVAYLEGDWDLHCQGQDGNGGGYPFHIHIDGGGNMAFEHWGNPTASRRGNTIFWSGTKGHVNGGYENKPIPILGKNLLGNKSGEYFVRVGSNQAGHAANLETENLDFTGTVIAAPPYFDITLAPDGLGHGQEGHWATLWWHSQGNVLYLATVWDVRKLVIDVKGEKITSCSIKKNGSDTYAEEHGLNMKKLVVQKGKPIDLTKLTDPAVAAKLIPGKWKRSDQKEDFVTAFDSDGSYLEFSSDKPKYGKWAIHDNGGSHSNGHIQVTLTGGFFEIEMTGKDSAVAQGADGRKVNFERIQDSPTLTKEEIEKKLIGTKWTWNRNAGETVAFLENGKAIENAYGPIAWKVTDAKERVVEGVISWGPKSTYRFKFNSDFTQAEHREGDWTEMEVIVEQNPVQPIQPANTQPKLAEPSTPHKSHKDGEIFDRE